MGLADAYVKAIDAVVNIWTPEALAHRPDWKDGFFAGKVKATSPMPGLSLEQMLERMAEAGIERGFLVAARTVVGSGCQARTTCPTRSSHVPARNSRGASTGWQASIRRRAWTDCAPSRMRCATWASSAPTPTRTGSRPRRTTISKAFSWIGRDQYVVDVIQGEDDCLMLAITVVIDMMVSNGR